MSSPDPPAPAGPPPPRASRLPTTGSILRLLTHTQHASAAVFGVFLGLHIAAPLAATVGGLSAADGVMVLGREIYLPLEPALVYAPLGLHLLSSATKRAITTYRSRTAPKLSTHQLSGYILAPLVIPHVLLHRVIPADPNPPISSLSPSEFGFEFAGYAADSRAWMAVGYVILAGVGVYHGLVGGIKVVGWAKRTLGIGRKSDATNTPTTILTKATSEGGVAGGAKAGEKAPAPAPRSLLRRIGLKGLVAALTATIALGVYRLALDVPPGSLGLRTVSRFDAVFDAAPWAKLGLK